MSGIVRSVKLAVVALLGAVVAGCSSAPVPGLADTSITVTAQFPSASGLYVGNPVSVLGMRVGTVTRITDRVSYVEVAMTVDKQVRVPADARAVTVSDSLLTDRHIELTPVYRDGPALRDGAVLGPDRTRVPVEFDSLLAMADKLSTSLRGDGTGGGPVAGLLDVGSKIAVGNGNELRAAMTELTRALQLGPDHGEATRAAVTTIVRNLDTLTAAASRNDQALRDFGSGVHTLSGILAEQNLGAGDTGTKLNQILIRMTELLERNRGNLKNLAGNANTMTTSMADYNDNLAEFLDVFPLVTDNAYNAIDQNIGALRGTVSLDKFFLDGQMLKAVCNLLGVTELGCATGTPRDMGPDFGIGRMLSVIAGAPPK
ncbi:virulence factor Mce-like protein [Nocardia transvalensis]|uniref:Virulence factor Mce-like protein n=1 Tax=Nocardia transvalensis TaxID=37333 RepID=A0A7W9PHU8_9NOCA|nr:MCE family protein [Nocardia transvalensis]MBB5915988.1 virulence factor Mce-like protein [Nocardia transvalensis]